LQSLYPKEALAGIDVGARKPIQIAASPVAVPSIVPPAGVAIIMLMVMFESQYPGIRQAVAICVAAILVLDFLMMFFVDRIMRTPGIAVVLPVIGSVLLFLQVAMAMQMALNAFTSLGWIKV
jgi:small neutral amino acid transporter SnatA (MarC family)